VTSVATKSNGKTALEYPSVVALTTADFNPARIRSFQEAIKDFVAHANEQDTNFIGAWNWIGQLIRGDAAGEIWWALDGDKVMAYFINIPQQLVSGRWSLFINQAWGHTSLPRSIKQEYLQTVVDDAESKGFSSVQLIATRKSNLMADFLGDDWKQSRTLFEVRF